MKDFYRGLAMGQITLIPVVGVFVFSILRSSEQNRLTANHGIMFIDSIEALPEQRRKENLVAWFKYYETHKFHSRGAAAVYYQAIIKHPGLKADLDKEIPRWVDVISSRYNGSDVMDL